MGKEQNKSSSRQEIINQIKRNPTLFVPTEKELQKAIAEREELDRELKEKGLTVILESNG